MAVALTVLGRARDRFAPIEDMDDDDDAATILSVRTGFSVRRDSGEAEEAAAKRQEAEELERTEAEVRTLPSCFALAC